LEEKLKKERDTVYYTCIILSRLHIGNYGDELLSIVKKYNIYIYLLVKNQQKINKMFGRKCIHHMQEYVPNNWVMKMLFKYIR